MVGDDWTLLERCVRVSVPSGMRLLPVGGSSAHGFLPAAARPSAFNRESSGLTLILEDIDYQRALLDQLHGQVQEVQRKISLSVIQLGNAEASLPKSRSNVVEHFYANTSKHALYLTPISISGDEDTAFSSARQVRSVGSHVAGLRPCYIYKASVAVSRSTSNLRG
ncbi:hypothetical protein MRX96_003004 [Rhipicephalus microplus]